MPQSNLDNTVRALFYQILLISSKSAIPADVTNVILAFYERHNLSNTARLEIDMILQTAGIYKIGKDAGESYIFKIVKNYKLSNDDSSRILNVARDLITKILLREELLAALELLKTETHSSGPELKNQISFLEQDIANSIDAHSNFIESFTKEFV